MLDVFSEKMSVISTSKKVQCNHCEKVMCRSNLARHCDRAHKDGKGDVIPPSSNESSTPSTRDHSPVFAVPRPVIPVQDAALDSLECLIQKIITCMLRRELRNDLGSLRRYLAAHFPQLPADLRDVVILTTFKTAQKVAAIHFDTLVDSSDNRSVWAVRSLTRWLHGLSQSEQMAGYNESPEHSEPNEPDEYSPLNNCFYTKELPVPINSTAQSVEAQREFDQTTKEILAAQAQTSTVGAEQGQGKKVMTSTSENSTVNLIEAAVPPPLTEQALKVHVPSADTRKVMCGVPVICDDIPEVRETPEKIPSEGEIMDSPLENFIDLAFHDLLQVETSDPTLKEVMAKPLATMVTPIVTPVKNVIVPAAQAREEGELVEQQGESGESSPEKVEEVPTKEGNREDEGRKKSKSPKKPRMEKVEKENFKQKPADTEEVMDAPKRKNAIKRKEVGERLTPITWKERRSCERPRSFQCKKGEAGAVIKSREMDIDDYRQPVPDTRIPFKHRQNAGRRSESPYPDMHHGRRDGFGRGYQLGDFARRGRPRALPFSRPPRMPGLSEDEQFWMDRMPAAWRRHR